jgi:hypothetical protein
MRIEIFTMCERAEQKGDDFSITNTFDGFKAPKVPFKSKPCFVVLRLRIEGIEADGENHILLMRVADFDGKVLLKTPPIPFRVNPPHGTRTLSTGFLFSISAIGFRAFGEHMIDISVDRIHLASIPLHVGKQA